MYNQIKYYVIVQKIISVLSFLCCIYFLVFYKERIIPQTILLILLTLLNGLTVFSSVKKKKERFENSFNKLGRAKLNIIQRHVFIIVLVVFSGIVRLGLPILINYI